MINKNSRAHWEKGLKREDIRLKVMEKAIINGIFNGEGNLANLSLFPGLHFLHFLEDKNRIYMHTGRVVYHKLSKCLRL